MNRHAIKTSLFLSLLFVAVYGSCNWLTSHRSDVGTFFFEWERHIPFVPLMIIPYMSIDLFFIAAPFLCRDDRERKVLSNRITAAILIAGVCFLLFPLRFAFERPNADGVLGIIFNRFREMDKPFNQFPSLHIALRTMLAGLYVARTRSLARWAVRIWFSLIGFSTLLTYQHHVIDIIGGFALAGLCIYFWQDQPLRLPVRCNYRVGIYYLICAIAMLVGGIILRPAGLLLLWPATSFGIVSSAYFGIGPGIFRKTDGRVPLISWLLLWPILLAQQLSLKHYSRQCAASNKLTGSVWIGRKLSEIKATEAIDQGVCAVLDLTSEMSEAAAFIGCRNYRNLPIMDLTAPTAEQFDQAIDFIQRHTRDGIVYIHCKAGYSRTAAIAGAYLLAAGLADTPERAIELLRAARPATAVRPEVMQALREYHARTKSESRSAPAHSLH